MSNRLPVAKRSRDVGFNAKLEIGVRSQVACGSTRTFDEELKMADTGLPPYALPMLFGVGFIAISLWAVNIGLLVIHRRDVKDHGPSSRLGNWAWGISLVSLLVPYLALISLTLGSVAMVKLLKAESSALHIKRPAAMALINSLIAVLFIVPILGVMVFGWTE
ncbi:MAG: hypothetical protein ACI9TH_003867 [Kiritimatiellia bacterium]|jgi:hypothetical protein